MSHFFLHLIKIFLGGAAENRLLVCVLRKMETILSILDDFLTKDFRWNQTGP
jgi:hypothetical protein